MPGGISSTGQEQIQKIVLELQTNFKKVLKDQIGAFDKFTKDTNTLSRQVGSSMNELARTTSKTFTAMYKGNKKEVQGLLAFTRDAMQGVRAESMRITALVDKQHQRIQQRRRQQAALTKRAVGVGKDPHLGLEEKTMLLDSIKKELNKIKGEIDKFTKITRQLVVKRLSNAVNESMKTIMQGSRAAAVAVNNSVNDMRSKFRELQQQQRFMTKAGGVEAGTRFLKERAAQIKVLDKLLSQHDKQRIKAQQHYEKQKLLLSKQTNKSLAAEQKIAVMQARRNLKTLESEYEFMFNKIQKFRSGQGVITEVFRKQAQAGVNAFKKELRSLNLESMFKTRWKNLESLARLSGKRTGDAFYQAAMKGKELDASLVKKQKHFQDLLKQAKIFEKSGLVNTRPQIRRFEAVITKIKEFRQEYLRTQKEISKVPQMQRDKFLQGGIAQANKIAFAIRGIVGELRKIGPVSEKNVAIVKAKLKEIEVGERKHASKIAAARKTLLALQKEIANAGTQIVLAANKRSAASWRAYQIKLEKIHKQIGDSIKRSVLPIATIKRSEKEIIQTVNRIRNAVAKSMIPSKTIEANLKKIEQSYKMIGNRIDELSKKRMVKPEHLKEGQAFIEQVGKAVKNYKNRVVELNQQLERLRRLQRAGLGGAGMSAQTAKMKEQMNVLRQHIREYEKLSMQMQRRMATAHRKSLAGSIRNSWEMVRNFRWQVAAIIYLITRAVWFVNRTIIKMLDSISDYRKSAFSIAAAISFQMVEKQKEAFDKAYNYARSLMTQLEMVAADTILSLEDMLMLTKTLAQAGIVPKTQRDVQRIATIGVAIKALTEGMANAGVQMRQELYAVIQGRQRATDQLAKMFQVMGINITKLIDDGKKEGKNLIEVLAEALRPFSEMNNQMINEWEQVKNRIATVGKLIARIGGEKFMLDWVKDLNALIDIFVTKTEDGFYQLTEKGVELAAMITATLNAFRILFNITVSIVSSIGNMALALGGVVSSANVAAASMLGMADAAKKTKNEASGLIFLMQVILQAFNMIGIILQAIAALIKSIVVAIDAWKGRMVGILEMWGGVFDLSWSKMKKGWGGFVKAGEKANKDIKDIWIGEGGWFKSAHKGISDINEQMEDMGKKAQGIWPEKSDLGELWQLPHNMMMMGEKAGQLMGKMQQATLAGLEGPEKFKQAREFAAKEYTLYAEQLEANINKILSLRKQVNAGEIDVDPNKYVQYAKLIGEYRKELTEVNEYFVILQKKEQKQLDDWWKKKSKKMAGWEREYKTFWESLAPKDLTRAEKTEKWLTKTIAKLDELRVKNPLIRAEFEKFSKQLQAAFGERQQDDIEATAKEIKSMQQQLTSHRVVDNVTKINNEFAKIELKAEKLAKNWLPKQYDEMKKLLDVTRKERIEIERMSMAHKASTAELEVTTKKAAYMMGSFSPIEQLKGEILELKTSYKKSLGDIQKEIDVTYKKWVKDGQWSTREGSIEAQRYVKALQEQLKELTKVTERELLKKQKPIWNDIVEASKSWSDGFTDSLTQIVDGIESVQDALDALQKQIIKDVLKIVIKRSITDQLMGALGSGSESPMAGFFGMFPGGKVKEGGAQEITATKSIPVNITNPEAIPSLDTIPLLGKEGIERDPIPVYIVNEVPGFEDFGQSLSSKVQGTTNAVKETTGVISDGNMAIIQSIMQGGGIGSASMQGYAKMGNDALGWAKAIGSVAMKAYGGGAGGAAGWAGSYGMDTGGYQGYGFAEGGRITEPIVGKGLQSGETYNFGENTKYGEDEIIAPMKKMQRTAPQQKVEYHMPIHINSIDTQTGVQFLMKHSDTIQGQMVKSLKQNKPIRKGIQNAY